jgi:hypothetical protein
MSKKMEKSLIFFYKKIRRCLIIIIITIIFFIIWSFFERVIRIDPVPILFLLCVICRPTTALNHYSYYSN